MAQPQYNDTDFTSLANEVFDITITVFDAGVFTAELDGGPYTGSGATITLIRDALLTSIQAGTHANYTAASQATDAIRITATGPGQFIGGTPNCTEPKFTAPGSGAITKTVVTPHEGIIFGVLYAEIEANAFIPTPLEPLRTAISWVSLGVFPRVLQINFTVDPLQAGEKSFLDVLVAGFTNVEIPNVIAQFFRTAQQAPTFVHLAADFVLATAGAPNFGVKLANIGAALAAGKKTIFGLQARSTQPGDTTEVNIDPGCCADVSGDSSVVLSSIRNIDIFTNGAGGLDTGSPAGSTWYAIYLIWKDEIVIEADDVDGLFSLNYEPAGPTMPSGFTKRRLIGGVLLSSVGDIIDYRIYGDGNNIRYMWAQDRSAAPFNVLTSGSATAWTVLDLSGTIPVDSYEVAMVAEQSGSPILYLREHDGSAGINQPVGTVKVRNTDADSPWMGVDSNRKIEYINSSGSGSAKVNITGYRIFR